MNLMEEIFEIRNCTEILVNDIEVDTTAIEKLKNLTSLCY